MARSLRISWENGQPRASFSHFMWRKPKTRQTNICSFFHNKHLREKTTNLREKTTALSLLRLYQLLFTCLLWKTTRHPPLVQFYTEQTKVQGSCFIASCFGGFWFQLGQTWPHNAKGHKNCFGWLERKEHTRLLLHAAAAPQRARMVTRPRQSKSQRYANSLRTKPIIIKAGMHWNPIPTTATMLLVLNKKGTSRARLKLMLVLPNQMEMLHQFRPPPPQQ